MFWSSATRVYRKPTHTGRYLNFNSNHPPHVKRGLIQILHNRASTTCQERQDLAEEISNLRSDLQLNGYPQGFIDSVINSKGSCRLNEEQKPLGSVYIPYVRGVSEKFKRIGNRYIRTIFKTRHTHENEAKKRSATDGTVHLQYSLWVWQKLHWRNKQTSWRAAPWTQAQSPTCLWRGS
jgi:hypothetical protein